MQQKYARQPSARRGLVAAMLVLQHLLNTPSEYPRVCEVIRALDIRLREDPGACATLCMPRARRRLRTLFRWQCLR